MFKKISSSSLVILTIIVLIFIGFQNIFASGAAWSIDGASGFDISDESLVEFDGNVAKLTSPYSVTSPYITPTTSQTFTSAVTSFSNILGSNNEGTVTYQVSTDNGATWNYWNTNTWSTTVATDGTETSTVSDINTNISTLDTDGGQFLWRAYFNSDGTEQVELDEVQITYDDILRTDTPTSTPDLTIATDSGFSSVDNLTNITSPQFIGGCYRDDVVILYDQNTNIGTATCSSNQYSITVANPLINGTHSISVSFTETGKTESLKSPALLVEIDTTAPNAETPDLIDTSDTGVSDTDNITTDNTPTFIGECETGSEIYLQNGETELASQVCSDKNSYNLTSTVLTDGLYDIDVKIKDRAGNEQISLPLSITINTSENFVCSGDSRFSGYAWSENIGWISFNCRDMVTDIEYGVTSDSTGNLSGYAWSENIGWIDFGYYGNAFLDLNTGILSGDALSISGLEDLTDGWDGKISLSGSSPSYGPILNFDNYQFNGFAWGSDVIGWINFNTDYSEVKYDSFSMSFTANKGLTDTNKVPYNGSVILSWSTDGGASSCTASDGAGTTWTGSNPKAVGFPVTSEETISNLTNDLIFTLTCEDHGGNQIVRHINIYVDAPAPYVSLTADNTNISSGSSTNLNWIAENVENCVASGDWSGSKATGHHSESTGNLTNTVNVFYLTCDSLYPADYPDPIQSVVQVNVEKLDVNFYAEYNPVPYNEKIKLYWETNFAQSCTASGNLPGFLGAIDYLSGINSFETDFITESGMQYSATLHCNGSNGQTYDKTLHIKVGRNPDYREI